MPDDPKKPDPILAKAQAIQALPKERQPIAILEAEQQADLKHSAKLDAEAARADLEEKMQADLEAARAKAVAIIGKSKDALMARIKERHGSFSHSSETDPETGDLVLHSFVLFGEGERARRVATARRIPRKEHSSESFTSEDLAAYEVEQLHVLATRLGV